MSTIPQRHEASGVAILRRVVHDLRVSLDAMRLSIDSLRRNLGGVGAGGEEFRSEQSKQVERLQRQVTAMNDLLARLAETLEQQAERAPP